LTKDEHWNQCYIITQEGHASRVLGVVWSTGWYVVSQSVRRV